MENATYIAVDLETTGLSPEHERIIEIGAIKYIDGEETARYGCLIQNPLKLPERIVELTGITDEMLAGGISEKQAIEEFLAFVGDIDVILGHNILFDYSFLKVAAERYGYPFEKKGLDTLRFAKELHKNFTSRSLTAMCLYYEIDPGHSHRATDDARSSHCLYRKLREAFPDYEGFTALPLEFKKKKTEPMTQKQKRYLSDLLKCHRMPYTEEYDLMTKSEASRMIDKLILTKGRMPRE